MGVYFIAAGNSSNNREKTLDRAHRLNDILPLVPPDIGPRLIDAFPTGEGVYAWGGSFPRHRKVLDLADGTYVVDIANAEVKQVFEFVLAYRAPDHQIQNYFDWDDHVPLEARRPYPLVYFLRDPMPTSRKESQWFRHALGIHYANWLPGQKLFADEDISQAMASEELPSVEAFLGIERSRYPESGGTPVVIGEPSHDSTLSEGGYVLETSEQEVPGVATSGQGYGLDSAERKAVERRAMDLAMTHYRELGYVVEDVGSTESFDLLCRRGTTELRVEVKGTTGDAASVLLTFNEVSHARAQHPHVALYVVSQIVLAGRGTDSLIATGGHVRLLAPWDVEEGKLMVETYKFFLPLEG